MDDDLDDYRSDYWRDPYWLTGSILAIAAAIFMPDLILIILALIGLASVVSWIVSFIRHRREKKLTKIIEGEEEEFL